MWTQAPGHRNRGIFLRFATKDMSFRGHSCPLKSTVETHEVELQFETQRRAWSRLRLIALFQRIDSKSKQLGGRLGHLCKEGVLQHLDRIPNR